MQDYMDSTSNVIEAACSTDALTGGNGYYNCPKWRVCKLGLLVVGFLVSSLDVATDWYNYHDATSRIQNEINAGEGDDRTTTVNIFMQLFCGVCVFGSLLWVMTFSLLLLQTNAICRKRQRAPQLEFLEEIVSMMMLVAEDLPMVAILVASISLRVCPLVEQMRTVPGQVALVSTGASIVFRMVHSLAFCCSCREKATQDRGNQNFVGVLMVMVRVLRTLLLTVAAVLFLFAFLVSFTPDPNKISALRIILEKLDLSGPTGGPIYIYQKYDLPYTVIRHVDYTKKNPFLPPVDDFETWSALKSRGRVQIDCDHYVKRIHMGDSIALLNAGPEGLSRTYACKDVGSFFKTSLPEKYKYLAYRTCLVTFTLVYDTNAVSLTLKSDFVFAPLNDHQTSSSCVHHDFDRTELEAGFTAPVIFGWPSEVLTSLKNYECQHSYECPKYIRPLFNPYHKPFFSCLGDICDISPKPIERDPDIREALHQFHYSPYRLVLPRIKAYFPCLASSHIERTITGGVCPGNYNRTASNMEDSRVSTQILSCLESPYNSMVKQSVSVT